MFSLQWAIDKLNAEVVGKAISSDTPVAGVCTDTRRLQPGDLFFALEGENADGHDYMGKALANGAVAAVVSRIPDGVTGTLLVVPDTLRAFGDLAMHYRRQFAIPVIGVTGSVGKTSTKEMIAAVLRTRYNTLASEKNYNNEIGVPQTIFQLTKQHEAAVIEMGMRGLGQIDRLAEIAQPTIGVITNIGYSHIELLGTQGNIARAKMELLSHLPANGVAVLPFDSEFWESMDDHVPENCRKIWFGQARSGRLKPTVFYDDVSVNQSGATSAKITVTDNEIAIDLKAPGLHHINNACAAIAVGYALNISPSEMVNALEKWEGAEGRMVVRNAPENVVVLDDCYNAGVESMNAALDSLVAIAHDSRSVVVIGDMKELGEFAYGLHQQLAIKIVNCHVAVLITVGPLARTISDTATSPILSVAERRDIIFPSSQQAIEKEEERLREAVYHFNTSEEAAAKINEIIKSGDTVLVKGSRAMGMEVIVAALMGNEAKAESMASHG